MPSGLTRNAAVWSLLATFAAQVGVAMAVMTVPVLAPQVARDLDVDPSRIGLYSAVVFAGAITFTAVAGSVTGRFGAIRTTQIAMFLGAGGLALSMTGWLVALIIGGFAIGMGYGVATPAASHLLARTAAPKQRGLIFSVKQTGVPLGGFLLGFTVPVVAAWHDWPTGLLVVVAYLLATAVALQLLRQRFDDDRDPDRRIQATETLAAVRMAIVHPGLNPLALSSFVYAMMQLSLFSFLVVVLVERGGIDPVEAGVAFSIMHLGGVVGRPLLGWISDRLIPARPLLAVVGVGIFLCALFLARIDASWPRELVWIASLLAGVIGAGWNGVYIAEIARVTERDQISRATGGVSAFAFLGVAIGPAVFSAVVAFSGSYAAAFLTVGTVALLPAAWLFRTGFSNR